jgi:hypothetical protein
VSGRRTARLQAVMFPQGELPDPAAVTRFAESAREIWPT